MKILFVKGIIEFLFPLFFDFTESEENDLHSAGRSFASALGSRRMSQRGTVPMCRFAGTWDRPPSKFLYLKRTVPCDGSASRGELSPSDPD